VWLADQRDRAEAIRAPTLVLCGAEDKVTPVDLSNELADLLPDARMEVIPRAGHLTNLEQPVDFNRIVDASLNDVERR